MNVSLLKSPAVASGVTGASSRRFVTGPDTVLLDANGTRRYLESIKMNIKLHKL